MATVLGNIRPMPLTLVSVPIGNPKDITLRALETLKAADVIVGEERKPLFRLLKTLGLDKPERYELLNEHSAPEDVVALAEICSQTHVALVTDCGTPGFCDPGAHLVKQCRKRSIPVTTNPGACSLSTFLSVTGQRLDQFYFQGFLPRETSERIKRLKVLDQNHRPFVVMDTPYRLEKTIQQILEVCGKRSLTLGTNLTQEDEKVFVGTAEKVLKDIRGQKREFLLLVQ